ncbi:MAG: hypothetical protein NC092_03320 [Butyrivibrio sp.]|nr:hypothetical protein [Muribaculum sp.]MCM1551704.1 hypothetical protein [Butyrivibrio sp.]
MKNKIKSHKILVLLAVISVLFFGVEGIIYYNNDRYGNILCKILLVLQNILGGFTLKPALSISDAIQFAAETGSGVVNLLTTIYAAVVVIAPLLTLTAIWRVCEYFTNTLPMFRKRKKCEHIILFGYNGISNNLIRDFINNRDKNRKLILHIFTSDELPSETAYEFSKNNCAVYNVDVLANGEKELSEAALYALNTAKYIILCEESSLRNFSLLLFVLNRTKHSGHNTKIFCRCEEDHTFRLAENYFDEKIKSGVRGYDLELRSVCEMQVLEMYRQKPLYSFYENTDIPVSHWDINLLIVGFGDLGMQALLSAMNLGVFSSNNTIRIDVVDNRIFEQAEIFESRISSEMFVMDGGHICLNEKAADGKLDIYFHEVDITHNSFKNLIADKQKIAPFNYVVVALNNCSNAIKCCLHLEEELIRRREKNIPIMLQISNNSGLEKFVKENTTIFKNTFVIPSVESVFTIEKFIGERIDEIAKKYNRIYSGLHFEGESGGAEWDAMELFKRNSSRAAAYHDAVKDVIFRPEASEFGIKSIEAESRRLCGINGSLFVCEKDSEISLACSEAEFMERLAQEQFAYEITAMEHRRWCYYMISAGWKYGEEKNMPLRINPCIVTQGELMQKLPYMCKYDLMYLIRLARELCTSTENDG